MARFPPLLQSPRTQTRSRLFTGPHLASWADAAAGSLVRADIYGIVNMYI
jgi:hypothetical protein